MTNYTLWLNREAVGKLEITGPHAGQLSFAFRIFAKHRFEDGQGKRRLKGGQFDLYRPNETDSIGFLVWINRPMKLCIYQTVQQNGKQVRLKAVTEYELREDGFGDNLLEQRQSQPTQPPSELKSIEGLPPTKFPSIGGL